MADNLDVVERFDLAEEQVGGAFCTTRQAWMSIVQILAFIKEEF